MISDYWFGEVYSNLPEPKSMWVGDDMITTKNELNIPSLMMSGISKSFPGVRALSRVDFKLRSGEIHALMGENGAGKSTLIKVLTGVYPMDEGTVRLVGRPVTIKSPQDAQKHGISTVYQEVNLCPNLTVAENLFLGREPRFMGLISWRQMNLKAAELLRELNILASPTAQLDSYSIAIQQMIAIARAVNTECRFLILTSPLSSGRRRSEKNLRADETTQRKRRRNHFYHAFFGAGL